MPLSTKGNWIVRAYGRNQDDTIDFNMKVIYQGWSRWYMFWTVIRHMTRLGAPKITIEWIPW